MVDRNSELIVCWREAGAFPEEATILSFLPPREHESLRLRHRGTVIAGREASKGVRTTARRRYLDMVAAAGITTDDDGLTLRERVGAVAGASRWWFHPVSFRDCESDPAYDQIVAVETIRSLSRDASSLILVGAPLELET